MKLSGIFGLRPSVRSIATSVAAVGALAIGAQANAADLYTGGLKDVAPVMVPPPPPVWTGFYAGINMGAAWSQLDINRFYEPGYSTCLPAASGGYCLGGDRWSSTNAFGGGQLGYNWQGWGNFVFGLEVDLLGVSGGNERSYFGVTQSEAFSFLSKNTPITASFKQDGGFAGDVTGRLGYAWGNVLLYAKGGFAWFSPQLSARATMYYPDGSVRGSFSAYDNNTTLTGWTVGGGVEWMLNPNWSVKVEYLYYDLGLNDSSWNASYCNSSCASYGSWKLFDNDLTVNTVKLGVNYHLTSAYVPLK